MHQCGWYCCPMWWHTHTCTHTHLFNGPFLGLPGWASTREVKQILILLKQETVGGSGISWAICKSAPHSREITVPAPHHSSFYLAWCSSCRPTNSVKVLKACLYDECVNKTNTEQSRVVICNILLHPNVLTAKHTLKHVSEEHTHAHMHAHTHVCVHSRAWVREAIGLQEDSENI